MSRFHTNEELHEIVALYQGGMSGTNIAKLYGCSHTAVYNAINRYMVHGKPYERQSWQIIYPNIERWMLENKVSTRKLANMCGRNYFGLRSVLIGEKTPKQETRAALLRVTGMDSETAFRTTI